MAYARLYDLLPRIANEETRSITVPPNNHFGLPSGEYGLIEMYCNDEDCDCQRVIIMVIMRNVQEPVAFISFGWESLDFYASWHTGGSVTIFSELDPIDQSSIKYMHGAHLNPMSPQSEIAQSVLDMIDTIVLSDKDYVDRLKRHYKLFRAKVDNSYKKLGNANKKTGTKKKRKKKK